MVTGMRRPSLELYLLPIMDAEKEGRNPKTGAIARELGVSPSSASEACARLARRGLLQWSPYHGIRLTESGRAVAENLSWKCRVLTDFLKLLGMSEKEAREGAWKLASSISDECVSSLEKILG